ncbi:MAG: hypothetical protein LBR73_05255 [Oscillospiraceae bacterium]|jgi:hypothetical protein|nr:hypothetical protein [Oscillospiraceae bacterium]
MKTLTKRLTALLLAFVAAIGFSFSVFAANGTEDLQTELLAELPSVAAKAAAEEPQSKEAAAVYPIVYLSGFGSQLYTQASTDPQAYFDWLLDDGGLVDSVWVGLGKTALKVLYTPWLWWLPNLLADAVCEFMSAAFGPIACDEEGNTVHDVANNHRNYPLRYALVYGRQMFEFHYDWRMDPWDTAVELRAYIDDVLAGTGAAKVEIDTISYGTNVVCAYLEQYGTAGLNSVFFGVSAAGGVPLVEELLQKHLETNVPAILDFAASATGNAAMSGRSEQMFDIATFLSDFSWVYPLLRSSAVAWTLGTLLNGFLWLLEDYLYNNALIPFFAQWPGLWSMVADDSAYENAKAVLLKGEKYAVLRDKIDRYHYNVAIRADEIIQDAAEEIKVGVLAAYGYAAIPAGAYTSYQGDMLIGSARESFGAIVAPYGETLGENYEQAVADGVDHLSPDGEVDASTCALPNQTWFFKGYVHKNDYRQAGMYAWFLDSSQPRVCEDYPQFTEYWW